MMKKLLYTLLIATMIVSVGCAKDNKIEETPAETPVETPAETPVEEPDEEPVQTPVGAEEPDEEIVNYDELFVVTPGEVSDEDILVGESLAKLLYQLMYNHGEENKMSEESQNQLKLLLDDPARIDEFAESAEYTLSNSGIMNVVDVAAEFNEYYVSTAGNHTILYDVAVDFVIDGETKTYDFKVTIVKRDNKLKIAGQE